MEKHGHSPARLAFGNEAGKYLEMRKKGFLGLVADAMWQLANPVSEMEKETWKDNLMLYCQLQQNNRTELEDLWIMAGGKREVIEDIFHNLPSK